MAAEFDIAIFFHYICKSKKCYNMSTRAQRREALRKEKKRLGYELSTKEKLILNESMIGIGKREHERFMSRAGSINSELEGKKNYEMYEHLLEFYKGDEAKAGEEYRKIIEHRESKK